MSESAITRLAEIRRLQGRTPLADPTKIDGFGPGLEPPPLEDPQGLGEPEAFDDPMEVPEIHVSKSPDHQPIAQMGLQRPASKELTVIERFATIHGFSVVLTESDRNDVAKIILKAIDKDLRGKLSEVTRKRRRKKGAAANDSGVVSEAVAVPLPRRRGRPKKVQA